MARGGVLDRTLSTASKRNKVMAGLIARFGRQVVRNVGSDGVLNPRPLRVQLVEYLLDIHDGPSPKQQAKRTTTDRSPIEW